ncbi:MAG TPA: hypothetical protein VNE39_09935 [Planctomycetota bacterium]|nr:hypothetical protein [Planctomycetota bacterium]
MALGAVSWLAAAADRGDEVAARLERRWAQVEKTPPNMGVRELFGFALDAAAIGWHPERIAKALGLAEQMQDRDEKSRTFGNFRWYWRAERPEDLNAVEFSMQQGILVWMRHKKRLDAEGVERLDRLIRFSVEGIRRHRVAETYTNIFLMKTWNCIAIGEATGRPDLADEGYAMLDRWLLHAWDCGVHEYVSPTYYGVDLDSLGLIARFAERAAGREKAEAALRFFWTDIAANWFEPGLRLGGAHSRDYDYLTGHGYLDVHLKVAGWVPSDPPFVPGTFLELCRWEPPRDLRSSIVTVPPRMVHQRWGAEPWQRAANYVGRRFSIGSGTIYEPTGKQLVVNLPGGPAMPVVNFLMDARGDAYGQRKALTGGGHAKALHLVPFQMSAQHERDALVLSSADPGVGTFKRWAPEPTCLFSHVVLPSKAEVWVGDAPAKVEPQGQMPVPEGAAVCLRVEDVAVGIRFVLGAPVVLVSDGGKHPVMRLTCVHEAGPPKARATVAVWARAAEGLDDAAFAAFRRDFAGAEAKVEGSQVDVSVPAAGRRLRLVADVVREQRLACEGWEPGSENALLMVNGRDLGREILGQVEPIRTYRRLLERAERGARGAARAGEPFEAESAAFVVPPFRVDRDGAASGGKFLWVPGEPGGKGSSPTARALWTVHVPKAGDYYLLGRVQAATPDDDSFFVRVRQAGRDVLSRAEWHTGVHATWEWTPFRAGKAAEATAMRLDAGVALIEVSCREDGTKLDALLLGREPTPALPPRGR